MALRSIRYDGDPILRKKARPVAEITPRILTLLDDMAETMSDKEGVGLAAPQVGVLRRVVIINVNDDRGLVELINPEIVERSGEKRWKEACLSVPGKIGLVMRPEFVKVKAENRDGGEFFIEGEGLLALALCHELDHLDGILYPDIAERVMDKDINDDDDEYEDDDDEYEDED